MKKRYLHSAILVFVVISAIAMVSLAVKITNHPTPVMFLKWDLSNGHTLSILFPNGAKGDWATFKGPHDVLLTLPTGQLHMIAESVVVFPSSDGRLIETIEVQGFPMPQAEVAEAAISAAKSLPPEPSDVEIGAFKGAIQEVLEWEQGHLQYPPSRYWHVGNVEYGIEIRESPLALSLNKDKPWYFSFHISFFRMEKQNNVGLPVPRKVAGMLHGLQCTHLAPRDVRHLAERDEYIEATSKIGIAVNA